MNLCFSTLGCTELELTEILALAKEHDIHALEIRGIDGVMDNRKIDAFAPDKLEETRLLFDQYDVSPRVLGTSCSFHTPIKYADAMEEGRASIDIAAQLGIPYIRVFGNNLVGENEAERKICSDHVAYGIKSLCDYASKISVSVLLEVHGDYNKIETLEPITQALAYHDHFGLIWDIAHTHAYGDRWTEFYRTFRPYIRHVHIKDRTADGKLTLPGEGDLPILPIVSTMLSDGFDGYFSLEWEKKWHPELPDLPPALKCFTAILNE